MFEKVSPAHPDKMCDRLAGAIVDLAYSKEKNPRIAVEVLAGHGKVFIIIETSLTREQLSCAEIDPIVWRIFGNDVEINVTIVSQDPILSDMQKEGMRTADNGIFKGCPPTEEQRVLTAIAATIYGSIPYDGKYIIEMTKCRDGVGTPLECYTEYFPELTICQSNATDDEIYAILDKFFEDPKTLAWWHKLEPQNDDQPCMGYMANINPLGPWTGGINVDCGCTNRKLGSDMGDGVTGGGLMGKDLSKADVSVNIVCFLKAVASGQVVTACCSIGDENVTFQYADGKTETETFADIVEMARLYILTDCGGSFEKFAEWGLIRAKDL